jgi:hypothetical protein
MAEVRLLPMSQFNHIVGTEAAPEVHRKTDQVGARAEAMLSSHRRTGEHEIFIEHEEIDGLYGLEGVHPESVEFGHWVEGKFKTDPPKFAEGLYIITGAAGLELTPKQTVRRSRR